MTGFHADDHVEGGIIERHGLCIAANEIQSGQLVNFATQLYAWPVEIESGVGSRVHLPNQVRRSAPVAATHLQHLLTADVVLARGGMIKLNAVAPGFVGRRQWNRHRGVFFITPVDKRQVVVAVEHSGLDCIAVLAQEVSNARIEDQMRKRACGSRDQPVIPHPFCQRHGASIPVVRQRAKFHD